MDENFGSCTNPASSYGKIKAISETGTYQRTCAFSDGPINLNFRDHIIEFKAENDNSTEE